MRKWRVMVIGAALLPALGGVAAAQSAQGQTPSQGPVPGGPSVSLPGRGPARIEIYPRRLLYRRCRAWYVLQDRPSGTVLFPQQHCWWVRG